MTDDPFEQLSTTDPNQVLTTIYSFTNLPPQASLQQNPNLHTTPLLLPLNPSHNGIPKMSPQSPSPPPLPSLHNPHPSPNLLNLHPRPNLTH